MDRAMRSLALVVAHAARSKVLEQTCLHVDIILQGIRRQAVAHRVPVMREQGGLVEAATIGNWK